MISIVAWWMMIFSLGATALAETCYVFIEKAGNFNPSVVESLSVSLISQYAEKVEAVPKAGIREDQCVYNVSLTESIDGFQCALSSQRINAMGLSRRSGMDGLNQSLLQALYRGIEDRETKTRICRDYPQLMERDCRPVEAVVMLYNEKGENIPDGGSVRAGEAFFVMLQPMADVYAAVFNKDSNGNFFRIFPNPLVSAQTNPLRSRQRYFFPPRDSELIFQFDENPGMETFYFIVSTTPLADIDAVYQSIESGSSKLKPVLEQRIRTRGIVLNKKSQPVDNTEAKMPDTGELLSGQGAVVKTIQLRHTVD